jgi:hypothetical protein
VESSTKRQSNFGGMVIPKRIILGENCHPLCGFLRFANLLGPNAHDRCEKYERGLLRVVVENGRVVIYSRPRCQECLADTGSPLWDHLEPTDKGVKQ